MKIIMIMTEITKMVTVKITIVTRKTMINLMLVIMLRLFLEKVLWFSPFRSSLLFVCQVDHNPSVVILLAMLFRTW